MVFFSGIDTKEAEAYLAKFPKTAKLDKSKILSSAVVSVAFLEGNFDVDEFRHVHDSAQGYLRKSLKGTGVDLAELFEKINVMTEEDEAALIQQQQQKAVVPRAVTSPIVSPRMTAGSPFAYVQQLKFLIVKIFCSLLVLLHPNISKCLVTNPPTHRIIRQTCPLVQIFHRHFLVSHHILHEAHPLHHVQQF